MDRPIQYCAIAIHLFRGDGCKSKHLVTLRNIQISLVSRKELQHMLHSRRKAEIEVLSGMLSAGTGNSAGV